MTAPSASWHEEKKEPMVREARRLVYDVATEAHTQHAKVMIEQTTNTGRRPIYSAVGTQKKFWSESLSVSLVSGHLDSRTYAEPRGQ